MHEGEHFNTKYSEQDLADKIRVLQKDDPLMTLAGLCASLQVNRNYITERAKKSQVISCAIKECDAIREYAWIKEGTAGLREGKDFNATVYIWMTRNIIGFRDDRNQSVSAEATKDGKLTINLGASDDNKSSN